MSEPRSAHHEFEETAGAYLLGALAEDEARRFEAHLEDCARCRFEVRELRVAADALHSSAPPVAPPPELKDRIMSVVRSEAELLQAAGAAADLPPPAPRRVRWSRLVPRPGLAWAAAAALAGTAVGVAGGLTLGGGGEEAKTVVASRGSAVLRIDDDGATLRVRRLPDPGEGRVYQVWLKRPGQDPEPTDALFGVRPDGRASVTVLGDLEEVDQVMVTSEPRGGSDVPSRPPIVVVPTA